MKIMQPFHKILGGVLLSLFLTSPALAVTVNFDPGTYERGYNNSKGWVAAGKTSTVDLPPSNRYEMTIGAWPNNTFFHIDSEGIVTSDSSRITITDANNIRINDDVTAPVHFDPEMFDRSYSNGRVWINAGELSTIHLLTAGTGSDDHHGRHIMTIGAWPNNTFFHIDSEGIVTSDSSRITITGANNIRINDDVTAPVHFDPGTFDRRYSNSRVWANAGELSTINLLTAGTGSDDHHGRHTMTIGAWPNNTFFHINSEGIVTSDSSRITITGANNIQINDDVTAPVNFDPGTFDRRYSNGRVWVNAGELSTTNLLTAGTGPDDHHGMHTMTTGAWPNNTVVHIDSGGTVTSNSSRITITDGNNVRINDPLAVQINPGMYGGSYYNGVEWITGISTPSLITVGTAGTAGSDDHAGQITLSLPINESGVFESGVFEVLTEPCSILPPDGLDISGVHFSISCTDLTPPDKDADGIPDEHDNCPNIPNIDQLDSDVDGVGDVCDADVDGDNVNNDDDNCPAFANTDQTDLDDDGIGDVCDDDIDGDSVNDGADNCPLTPNTGQSDGDGDGLGNACDADDDNDSIVDEFDNCPSIANTEQADTDSDGLGDVCDADEDGDSVGNDDDLCPLTPAGSAVTDVGCSGAQFIELNCLADSFPNHGKYVSCVAHTANDLVDIGLITKKDKARFVSQAAKNK